MMDTTAFTGMKMFYITRKLLVSIAANIITYEIFLIQFSPKSDGRVVDFDDDTEMCEA